MTVDLSIIVPLYNEEENVHLMHAAIVAALRPLGLRSEIVFVDDGSRDATFAECLKLPRDETPLLRLVKLRRNYGQTAAMSAGIEHARGQVLITMDGDLQNDPNDIPSVSREDKTRATISSSAGGTSARITGRGCCPRRWRTG